MRILSLNIPEEELIRGCQKGRQRMQQELYRRYASRMYGLCMRYAGSREEAQDVLQEGFVKAFDKMPQYQFTGSFEGWLRRIMLSTAIDHYRRRQRHVPTEELLYETDTTAHWQPNTLDLQAVVDQVQLLPEGCRTVFNLFAVEGYSHKEIADMLGISEGTSRSQLNYAKRKLQQWIENHAPELKHHAGQG